MSARRQRIIEAFVFLACASGYAAVSMRSLASQIGVQAPSIYSHFPGGRDEIVTEAFRWHFRQFAFAILASVEGTQDVDEYWNSLIRVHLQRQLEYPENDLLDILMATDRANGLLPAETLSEYHEWRGIYERLHAAAALELGHTFDDVGQLVKLIVTILDAANTWSEWDGSAEGLDSVTRKAGAYSRALMGALPRSA